MATLDSGSVECTGFECHWRDAQCSAAAFANVRFNLVLAVPIVIPVVLCSHLYHPVPKIIITADAKRQHLHRIHHCDLL